jgi:DNA repair protein RecO
MNQIVTQGIVLRRTEFGEADRIVVLLTPDHGKISLVAKGVRRLKSKLAGGIELFSVSDITFIKGRGDLGTLVSARLDQHYNNIAKDINRVQLGYELIKLLNNTVEDDVESDFFDLLHASFQALNDADIPLQLTRIWFSAQMLRLTGHMPNTQSTRDGKPLEADKQYDFDLESMTCIERPEGGFGQNHVKFMRLLFSGTSPKVLAAVQGVGEYVEQMSPLIRIMTADYLRS